MTSWQVREVDAQEFARTARDWVCGRPVEGNVLLSRLDGILSGRRPDDGDLWLVVHDEGGHVAGAGFRTPGRPLFQPPMSEAAVAALAGWYADRDPELWGVSAERETAARFAAQWRRRTGTGAEHWMSQRMYVVADVEPPSGVAGAPRVARESDIELCAQWLVAFSREAHPVGSAEEVGVAAARQVREGTLVLWEDGPRRVSLAGWRPPSSGVARVGPVYTPPAHRRHGYGSAVTAAATRMALAAGAQRAMLYTDLANPSSNALYQRLGYRPVTDAAVLRFRVDASG
jgi:RimJ/RimL family protein N-acetyltransferase